jgi:hypothetical protein
MFPDEDMEASQNRRHSSDVSIMKAKNRALVFVAVVMLGGSIAHAAPDFFSFGGDDIGVPRDFHRIFTDAATATSQFELGDGAIGFNGGVTFRPSDGLFYAIRNDSDGNSALTSFSLSGPGTLVELFDLGVGFNGGLVFNPTDQFFYAISNDTSGASTLNRFDLSGAGSLTPLFELGIGFNGGLTFNGDDGLLYAVSNDEFANSTLQQISLAGGGSVAVQFALGVGFYGGVAYDPDSNLFFALASDSDGNSTLYQATTGGIVTPLFAVGTGFNNAGLTVPEPTTIALMLMGIGPLAYCARRCLKRYA